MVEVSLPRPYCNVRVYRLARKDGRTIRKDLVAAAHNLVTDAGLDQLKAAAVGTAWQLSGIGLGDDDTAPAASDTWGGSELLCEVPTSSYYKDGLYRASLLIEEGDLVGEDIKEVWIAPGTAIGGGPCYARVVIGTIAKTADYAYLFLFDCTWTGGDEITSATCEMFAALAKSGGAYTYALDEVLLGGGTKEESSADTGLELPWAMTPLALASATSLGTGFLSLTFTIPPDTYVGNVVREVGLYFTLETGASPITAPAMFCRMVLDDEYEVPVGEGATVSVVIKWEAG